MHEFQFSDSILPARPGVLNLALRDYTLGHELLLLRNRNAFILLSESTFNQLDPDAQQRELRRAVLICCDDWSYHQRLGQSSFMGWRLRWHNFNVRLLQRRVSGADIPLAIADFRNYLAEAHETLPAPDERADEICADANGYDSIKSLRGRSFGAPHHARLLNFVTAGRLWEQYGFTTPYDFPLRLAQQLYVTQLETEGAARVENSTELEEKENWAQMVEKVKARREKEAAEAASKPETRNPKPETAQPPPVVVLNGELLKPEEPSTSPDK